MAKNKDNTFLEAQSMGADDITEVAQNYSQLTLYLFIEEDIHVLKKQTL